MEDEARRIVEKFLQDDGKQHREFVSMMRKRDCSYSTLISVLKIDANLYTPAKLEDYDSNNKMGFQRMKQISEEVGQIKRKIGENDVPEKRIKSDPGVDNLGAENAIEVSAEPSPVDECQIVMDSFHIQTLEKFRLGIENARPWAFMGDWTLKGTVPVQPCSDSSSSDEQEKVLNENEEVIEKTLEMNNHIPIIELSKESQSALAKIREMLALQEGQSDIES